MTFESFKNYCEAKKSGKVILPRSDDEYRIAILEAIIDVSTTNNIIPLVLVTNDKENEVLKPIDDEIFIRVPTAPKDLTDKLDIDSSLCFAVLYSFLEKVTIGQESTFYASKKEEEVNKYNWSNFKAIESTGKQK